MWSNLREGLFKSAKKEDSDIEDILKDIRASRMYFGHALQSSALTGWMEEYLFRGLAKLYEVEDKLGSIK